MKFKYEPMNVNHMAGAFAILAFVVVGAWVVRFF